MRRLDERRGKNRGARRRGDMLVEEFGSHVDAEEYIMGEERLFNGTVEGKKDMAKKLAGLVKKSVRGEGDVGRGGGDKIRDK